MFISGCETAPNLFYSLFFSSVLISDWGLRCLWCPAEDLRLDGVVKSLPEQLAAITRLLATWFLLHCRMAVGLCVNKKTQTEKTRAFDNLKAERIV